MRSEMVVVKIMVPCWVPIIMRHLIFRVPEKGTIILTTTQMEKTNLDNIQWPQRALLRCEEKWGRVWLKCSPVYIP